MKLITLILLAALACLVGLRILNQSRRNHVEFVTFSSDEEPGPENPVEHEGFIGEVLEHAAPVQNDGDFRKMTEELEEDNLEGDAMAVLYDRRTRLAIVSFSVMSQISAGNRAVTRKVLRFLSSTDAENVLVSHVAAKVREF